MRTWLSTQSVCYHICQLHTACWLKHGNKKEASRCDSASALEITGDYCRDYWRILERLLENTVEITGEYCRAYWRY